MLDLFESKVYETIKQNNMILRGDKIVAGLSGGADSCAMLHALHKLSRIIGFELCAAHLEHGIRGNEALRDLEFSREFAKNLGKGDVDSEINNIKAACAKLTLAKARAEGELARRGKLWRGMGMLGGMLLVILLF